MKIVRPSLEAFARKTTTVTSCGSINYNINYKFKKYLPTCLRDISQPRFFSKLTYFHEYQHHDDSNKSNCSLFIGATFAFLGFFESKEQEQEEEPPLITTLKRSILLIQVRYIFSLNKFKWHFFN